MASPAILHLNSEINQADYIYVGDTYVHPITFLDSAGDPIDKSGKTFISQIKHRDDDATVVANFAVSVSGAGNNIVTISLTSSETLAIESGGGYLWDLREIDGAAVATLAEGKVLVVDDVSDLE